APAGLHEDAAGDETVVLLGDAGRHVAPDDAGADLVDGDALLAEAGGPELRRHRHPRLRDAVLAAVRRDHRRGDRADVDDGAAEAVVSAALLDHPIGDGLCEEIRPLEVDAEHPVEALLGGVEEVTALARADAGVVDEQVEPAELAAHGLDEALAVGGLAHVGRDVEHLGAEGAEGVERLAHLRLGAAAAEGEVEPLARERLGDAEADAAGPAGDEGDSGRSRHEISGQVSEGTSSQRRSFQDASPSSASCTPLAPSSSPKRYGSSATTWRRNSSHCTLNALS